MRTKNKMRLQASIQRAKRSALGRMFCRLAGDEVGGVMMEYVIVAVMIAAAVTLTVIFFGDAIQRSFTAMVHALGGQTDSAAESMTEVRDKGTEAGTVAKDRHEAISGQ